MILKNLLHSNNTNYQLLRWDGVIFVILVVVFDPFGRCEIELFHRLK